jgi:hypothetical protein
MLTDLKLDFRHLGDASIPLKLAMELIIDKRLAFSSVYCIYILIETIPSIKNMLWLVLNLFYSVLFKFIYESSQNTSKSK